MTIHYNLYRFGEDEFAVAHLINGDLPADDEERWRILDAPRYHIQKLLDEHLRAQAALCDCRDSGRPFVLFLRSFSSEYWGNRIDGNVAQQWSLDSVAFQQWLKLQMGDERIPLLKLHGGSDGFFSDMQEYDGKILSTHSDNWKTVATELVQAASAIVFLVSHMTEGVVEEFDLIRELDQMHRCLVVLLDPSRTPNSASNEAKIRHASLVDFPNVFELPASALGINTSYPQNLGPTLTALLHGARTQAPLEQALTAEFTYLEPGFTDSEDFAFTERRIWRGLRLLRVMFEDTYWAALKSHGILFQHFTFPGPWKVAHQLYGLAIATADFRAIREALSYLSILYVVRGADFALAIPSLASKYVALAAKIFRDGEPDTEVKYASGPDPLKEPAKIRWALDLFELAETLGKRQDSEQAVYFYQAAVICALRARDCDDHERRWMIANMCRDWAQFQGGAAQLDWGIANCMFAVTLFRDLASSDAARHTSELGLCLNNLGVLQFNQRDFPAAETAFVEALKIRRAAPSESKNYLVNLHTSLANLGLVRVEMGDFDAARALYGEALTACDKRMSTEPEAIVDLTRLQGWMSLCLARIPDAKREGLEYARRAASNLEAASQISPESPAALRPLVEEAIRVNSGMT